VYVRVCMYVDMHMYLVKRSRQASSTTKLDSVVPSSRSDLLPIVTGLKRYRNPPRAFWRSGEHEEEEIPMFCYRVSAITFGIGTTWRTELLLCSPSTRNSLRANPMQFKRIYKDWPKRRLVVAEIDVYLH